MLATCKKYVKITVEKADGTVLVDEKLGDEPLFPFRGQDRFAADVLRYYVTRLRMAAGVAPEFIEHMEEHIAEIERWPVKKTPD